MFHKAPALHGAVIDGHVDGVVAAGPMKNPAMTVVFDDIRLADGTKEPVNVVLITTKQFDPKSHKLRTIGLMIGGAVAGHAIAASTGRKHGALTGAVGGYALSQTLKTDVAVPAGSVVESTLQIARNRRRERGARQLTVARIAAFDGLLRARLLRRSRASVGFGSTRRRHRGARRRTSIVVGKLQGCVTAEDSRRSGRRRLRGS